MITLFELDIDNDLDGSDVVPLLRKTGKAVGTWVKDKADESEIGLKKLGHATGKVAHSAWKSADRATEDIGDSVKIAYQKSKRYLGDKYDDVFDKPSNVLSKGKRFITRSWRDTFDDPEDNVKGARKSLRAVEDRDYVRSVAKRAKEITTDENELAKKFSARAKRKVAQLQDVEAGQKLLKQQKEGLLINKADLPNDISSSNKSITKTLIKSNPQESDKPSLLDRAKEFIKKNVDEKSSDKPSLLDRAKGIIKKNVDEKSSDKPSLLDRAKGIIKKNVDEKSDTDTSSKKFRSNFIIKNTENNPSGELSFFDRAKEFIEMNKSK